MNLIGHLGDWPIEVGHVVSGVSYSVGQDGQVYRYDLSDPGAVKAVGVMGLVPLELEALWDACEALYWAELTLPKGRASAPDLTPTVWLRKPGSR